MFNMFKHEDSVIFDPIWCSVIGSISANLQAHPRNGSWKSMSGTYVTAAVPRNSLRMT